MVKPLVKFPENDTSLESECVVDDGASNSAEMQAWLDALLLTRDTPANRETLGQYLFDTFAAAPEQFYAFLVFLRARLTQVQATEESAHLARQYLAIVAPLAARFGIFAEKNILDELCFQILHPADYAETNRLLEEHQRQSQSCIEEVTAILRGMLAEHGFEAEVEGRFKSAFSIHQKLQKKRRALLELHDIFAFRIILEKDDPEACFDVLNLLHDTFHPVASRFKDYISIPKINGYQSVHTCLKEVLPTLDWPVEVQIRTRVMDGFAKEGLASHWIYSQTKKSTILSSTQKRIKRQATELTRDSGINHRVYFFSARNGDIFALPQGATVHDFAYHLHSDLGDWALYAVVNGTIQQLDYLIQNNDRITVITAPENKAPSELPECQSLPHIKKKKLYVKAEH